jgi:hypothetical protein
MHTYEHLHTCVRPPMDLRACMHARIHRGEDRHRDRQTGRQTQEEKKTDKCTERDGESGEERGGEVRDMSSGPVAKVYQNAERFLF